MLDTALFSLTHGQPHVRGTPLRDWLDRGFEAVAAHLWQLDGSWPQGASFPEGEVHLVLARALLDAAARDEARHAPPTFALAARVVRALAGPGDTAAHALALRWQRPEATDRALVSCAEHELNASTFACRVAASTGADLYLSVLAGLAAHSGPLHGRQSIAVLALMDRLDPTGSPAPQLARELSLGQALPGIGHRLYPDGDPRFSWLFDADAAPRVAHLALGAHTLGLHPNVDLGLAALVEAWDLPAHAGVHVFAAGRSAGWVAHALEQRRTGQLIRPRAAYRP